MRGLKINFFKIRVKEDGYYGEYGPIESAIADILIPYSNRNFQNLSELRIAMDSSNNIETYQSRSLGSVDCALWDIKARRENKSVAEVSSKASQSKSIPCYASMITLDIDGPNTQVICEILNKTGFWGQKWTLPDGPMNGQEGLRRNIARVKKIREASPNGRLMLEVHNRWTPEYLDNFLRLAEVSKLTWIEDPFPLNNVQDYLNLENLSVPICLGETFSSPEEFDPFIKSNCQFILQTDILACGGYSEALKINNEATKYSKQIVHHGRRLIPSLHLASGKSKSQLIEFNPIFEPQRQITMSQRILPKNGYLRFNSKEWEGLWQK